MKAPECRPRLRRPVARLARAAPREGGAPSEAAASHAKANGAAPPPPLAKMIRNNNCSSVLATSGPFSAVSLQIRLMLLHFSICNEIYKINKLNFEKCVKNLLHFVSNAPGVLLAPRCAASGSAGGSTWQGSFSDASKPNFARKYALESSRRDLHNALLCTALQSQFVGQNLFKKY